MRNHLSILCYFLEDSLKWNVARQCHVTLDLNAPISINKETGSQWKKLRRSGHRVSWFINKIQYKKV